MRSKPSNLSDLEFDISWIGCSGSVRRSWSAESSGNSIFSIFSPLMLKLCNVCSSFLIFSLLQDFLIIPHTYMHRSPSSVLDMSN